MTTKLTSEELAAYFALISAGDLLQRAVSAQLADHELTPVQFSVLAQLLDVPAGLRMSDLADQLVVSRSGLTYQVTQLEKAGLVERASSSTDNRGVVAQLTAAGRARVLEVFPGHVELVRENFLELLDAGEIATIRTALGKVVARLRHG